MIFFQAVNLNDNDVSNICGHKHVSIFSKKLNFLGAPTNVRVINEKRVLSLNLGECQKSVSLKTGNNERRWAPLTLPILLSFSAAIKFPF